MRSSVIAVLVSSLLAVACGGGDSGTNMPSTAPTTSTPSPATPAPTFTDVYTKVLTPRCTTCHMTPGGTGITQGKLDMSVQSVAYSNLVGVVAAGDLCAGKATRVVPGEPTSSLMFLKVSLDDLTPCGDKMPSGRPALTREEADIIKGWIAAGAKND